MSNLVKLVLPVAALIGAVWLAVPTAKAAERADLCTAQAPNEGVLHGPVLHVEDGRTLCVALGATPDRWVRLTLADARVDNPVRRASTAPADDNPRGTLMAVAFSQTVDCNVVGDGRAVCILQDGRSIGAALKTPAAWSAGRDWR